MKNYLLMFFAVICFAQTSYSQKNCCTGIYSNVIIDDCDVTICVYPTDILTFCEDFQYDFLVDVVNGQGQSLQTFETQEFCYSNFQGIPGEEYTVTYTTKNLKACDATTSTSVTFTFPEHCQNCCVEHEVEAEVTDCVIQYCLVPTGPLCEEPVGSLSRVRDQFGDLVQSIQTSMFCYEVTDVQGGISYTIGGSMDYDLACDVSRDVIPATITVPEECVYCENECIELLTWVISPGETCQSTQWISAFYDSCNDNFIQNPEGYQFSWVGTNGVTSDEVFVVFYPGVTFTATLVDPDGCVFLGTVGRYCPEPGMQNDGLINTRENMDFVLSPNPTIDVVNILGLDQEKDLFIMIHSIDGQMIGQWKSNNNSELSINIADTPIGQYVLTVMDEKQVIANKQFVKN